MKKEAGAARRALRFSRMNAESAETALVRTSRSESAGGLPPVLQPAASDVDLAEWARHHRASLENFLLRSGALLFRGFLPASEEQFERVAEAFCDDLFADYGDLPHEKRGKLYSATPYPADREILYHNEASHTHCWPRKIFFYCRRAAGTGGQTPVADCRSVLHALPAEVRQQFESKGLLYVRNFLDGLSPSWQEFFGSGSRDEVEQACRRRQTRFEWRPRGLRIWQHRLAVTIHPETREKCFFNQVLLHHPSALDPEVRTALDEVGGPEDRPRNVLFGDGEPIPEPVIQSVLAAFRRTEAVFAWQDGDILLVDNILAAHARRPYRGRREVLVAMGGIQSAAATPASESQ